MRKKLLLLVSVMAMLLSSVSLTAFAQETTALTKEGFGFAEDTSTVNSTYVAQIGETKYETLAAAVEAAKTDETVTILSDISLAKTVKVVAGQKLTLDLNGKTIDSDPELWVYGADYSGTALISVLYGGDLTIKDSSTEQTGTLDASVRDNITGAYDVYNTVCLTYKNDNNANGPAKLTVNGGNLIGSYYGIGGNGSRDTTELTINGGYITGNAAIWQPQEGTVTITGGTLVGFTAVYMKSGSLNITGGTLIGNGAKVDYVYTSGSGTTTGDALIIENVGTDGYQAIGTVSITGGTFESANADAIGSYAATKANPLATEVSGFITGGTFSSDVSSLCSESFVSTKNADGTYGIVKEAEALTTKRLTVVDMPTTEDGKYQVGCFAAVDSLEYNGMGIQVTANNGTFTKNITLTELYNSLIVGDTTYTAANFGAENGYIFGTVVEVDNDYSDFQFRPYALKDGKTVSGSWSTKQSVSAAQ